jgi:2-oxo-4-hydroxy-4-carboxy--5-ureidoimidazoline (OHCU) decarboxylase
VANKILKIILIENEKLCESLRFALYGNSQVEIIFIPLNDIRSKKTKEIAEDSDIIILDSTLKKCDPSDYYSEERDWLEKCEKSYFPFRTPFIYFTNRDRSEFIEKENKKLRKKNKAEIKSDAMTIEDDNMFTFFDSLNIKLMKIIAFSPCEGLDATRFSMAGVRMRKMWQFTKYDNICTNEIILRATNGDERTYIKGIPNLFFNIFPFTDNLLEKRNTILLNIMSNLSAQDGFSLIEDQFSELLAEYNKKQEFPFVISNSIMLPWKKEVLMAAQIKQGHVLINGESGTGKEMTAELVNLKTFGARAPKLKKINCAMIDENLATSLLFGHKKGSFTGANEDSQGIIYNAHKGALFLDEIHYLPKETLGKLLRFMEDGMITKLGGHKETRCDVKIIAATNSDEFTTNDKLHKLGFIQRFNFSIYIPPIRVRNYMYEFRDFFDPLWKKAISSFQKSQKIKCFNGIDEESGINFVKALTPYRFNVEEVLQEYTDSGKGELDARKIALVHAQCCFERCFTECRVKNWENSNLRGIYNYIINSITSYVLLHPDFIYEKNVNDAISSPGRKSSVEFDELYGLMMNFKKQNKNGIELQKEIFIKYGAFKKKNSLNNYLQRYKIKYKSNTDIIEKIEELRDTIRVNGCFFDYLN